MTRCSYTQYTPPPSLPAKFSRQNTQYTPRHLPAGTRRRGGLDIPGGDELESHTCTEITPQLETMLAIINKVHESGVPNYKGVRHPLPTNFNIALLQNLLIDYADREVVDLLLYGFPIQRDESTPLLLGNRNHKGATEFPDHVDAYIDKELCLNATMGPFKDIPFTNMPVAISPLSTREKRDSDERRIIMDCSWPIGSSLNDGISKYEYLGQKVDLVYPKVDDLCCRVHELRCMYPGRTIYFYKEDLNRAFRQYPADPGSIPLLGFKWRNRFYFDLVMMMGCRIAPAIAQRVSNMITFIMFTISYFLLNYMDDFIGAEIDVHVHQAHATLKNILRDVGLDRSLKKSVPPNTTVEFIGNLFNSTEFTVGIIPSRRVELLRLLDSWRFKTQATKREWESLIGKLQYVSNCVRPGRLFTSRLIQEMKGLPRYGEWDISDNARLDIKWWYKFLPTFKGESVMWLINTIEPSRTLATDACLQAAGAVYDRECFTVTFPQTFRSEYSITHLELWAIIIAVRLWGNKLRGTITLCKTDNEAVSKIVNTGRSHDDRLQVLLRELLWWAASYEVKIVTRHLEGKLNVLPDLLSRWGEGDHVRKSFMKNPEAKNVKFKQIPSTWFKLHHTW